MYQNPAWSVRICSDSWADSDQYEMWIWLRSDNIFLLGYLTPIFHAQRYPCPHTHYLTPIFHAQRYPAHTRTTSHLSSMHRDIPAGIFVEGLLKVAVESFDQIRSLMDEGNRVRWVILWLYPIMCPVQLVAKWLSLSGGYRKFVMGFHPETNAESEWLMRGT